MNCYLVGGAVRDALLGLPVRERDWVMVGATPEEMTAAGYKPVGKDFPVFLHPQTKEEHALARTERKSGRGYHGFTFHTGPEVTLEEDLIRRDLTVNAIAQAEDGTLIDPHGGRRDLEARLLRHVSPAFLEDPVRVLRVARFHARFAPLGFRVTDETLALMRQMVADGEVDQLVAERVWQEMSRALMGPSPLPEMPPALSPLPLAGEGAPKGRVRARAQPAREGDGGGDKPAHTVYTYRPSVFFATLRDCGALGKILPEVNALFGVPQRADYHPEVDSGIHTLMCVDAAARANAPLPVRVSALLHDLGKALTPKAEWPSHKQHEQRGVPLVERVCERLRLPAECRELAIVHTREHLKVHIVRDLRPETLLELLDKLGAFRQGPRFQQVLMACESDAHGRTGFEDSEYPQTDYLRAAAKIAASVQAADVMAEGLNGPAVGEKLRERRVHALAQWKKSSA